VSAISGNGALDKMQLKLYLCTTALTPILTIKATIRYTSCKSCFHSTLQMCNVATFLTLEAMEGFSRLLHLFAHITGASIAEVIVATAGKAWTIAWFCILKRS
jgi:hypothetical protein